MDEVSTEECVKLSNEEFQKEKELEEELGSMKMMTFLDQQSLRQSGMKSEVKKYVK